MPLSLDSRSELNQLQELWQGWCLRLTGYISSGSRKSPERRLLCRQRTDSLQQPQKGPGGGEPHGTTWNGLRLTKNQRPCAFHRTSLHSHDSEIWEKVHDHGDSVSWGRLLMPLSLAFQWSLSQCVSRSLSLSGEHPTLLSPFCRTLTIA